MSLVHLCELCGRRLASRRDHLADLAYHAGRLALLLNEEGNQRGFEHAYKIAEIAFEMNGGRRVLH